MDNPIINIVELRDGLHTQRDNRVKIKARRNITTQFGFIAKGQVGFVPRSWIEKIITGGCSCRGSINWFEYV